jgi:hypothetical protein
MLYNRRGVIACSYLYRSIRGCNAERKRTSRLGLQLADPWLALQGYQIILHERSMTSTDICHQILDGIHKYNLLPSNINRSTLSATSHSEDYASNMPLPTTFRLTCRRFLNTPFPRTTALSLTPFVTRPFSRTPALPYPRKDSQDKDSIDTEATEYSKSGTDDGAARQDKAAFDPSTTDPQKEKDIAGGGNEVSIEI